VHNGDDDDDDDDDENNNNNNNNVKTQRLKHRYLILPVVNGCKSWSFT
jgi:hypothetical protein